MISAYRDHGHCLARGSDPGKVMVELFGKATGLCQGKGGSRHFVGLANRFKGGYAIVGEVGGQPSVPLAIRGPGSAAHQ